MQDLTVKSAYFLARIPRNFPEKRIAKEEERATYQLSDGFGEEAVVAAIGRGRRSSGLEAEVSENLPIRKRPQNQLLRELFLFGGGGGGSVNGGGGGEAEEGEREKENRPERIRGHFDGGDERLRVWMKCVL